jgi:hypothetical protein
MLFDDFRRGSKRGLHIAPWSAMRLAMTVGKTCVLAGFVWLVQGCSGGAASVSDPVGGESGPTPAGEPVAQPSPDGSAPGEPDAGASTDSGAGDGGSGSAMTFFVSSTGSGAQGGDLGGLAGADKKCQDLATAAGAGGRTWHAYLSVDGTNARDRIGAGPWKNQKGKVIATSVAQLHSASFLVVGADIVDERGAAIPAVRHGVLTGTNPDGTLSGATCNGFTSAARNQSARVGHSDADTTTGGPNSGNDRWNSARNTNGCRQQDLDAAGGEGRIYCFATN